MKKIICIVIILLAFESLKAQDGQLSYIYASPLSINPANTGITEGAKWRAMTTIRKQWTSFLDKGITNYSLSFDAPFHSKKVALGGLIYSNSAASGAVKSISACVSFAYSTYLSHDAKTKLAFGLQAGFNQKSFDPTKLTFDNQYVPGVGFDQTLDSREHFSRTSTMYPDFNFGTLFYKEVNATQKFFPWVGISVFHLTQPNESFYTSGDSKLPRKYIASMGARIRTSENFSIAPHILMVTQAGVLQFNAGGTFLLDFNKFTTLSFGMYVRNNDAGIAMIGLEYDKFALQFVYDINTSTLSPVTRNFGGYEVTLKYLMKSEKKFSLF